MAEHTRNCPASGPRPTSLCGLSTLLLVVGALALGGCTRHFFREHADKEAEAILKEKDRDPWQIEQFHVYPDPRARFADLTCPDHPPMPPDDPGAYALSPNPQKPGKACVGLVQGTGYLELLAAWDALNRTVAAAEEKDNPVGAAASTAPVAAEGKAAVAPAAGPAAPATESGSPPRPFLIKLDQAVEMGGINSREFQDRREDLYLTALPVTLERFAFAAQFLAAEQAVREWSGKGSPEGSRNRWSLTSNGGIAKVFSTGALLLLNFANQTVVDFTRFPKTISESTISLDLIQPLLRGGGKAVTLEPLTQSERDLLYQVRSYARFRKEFYVSIAGGGGGSINGGAFVPSGIVIQSVVSPGGGIGASGLVPGVPPPVQLNSISPQVNPGQSGRLNLRTAIPATAAGYFGTLLQFSQIAIDQENIEALERFLRLFRAFKEGGDVSQLQVDQVEQQLLQGRSTKLTDEQQYGNAIDQFRVQLGLPTALPLELDNAPLRELTRQFRRYEQVFRQFTAAQEQAESYSPMDEAPLLRERLTGIFTAAPLVQGTRFRTQMPRRWAAWASLSRDQDSKELRDRRLRLSEERTKLLDLRADLEKQGKPLSAADQRRLNELEFELDLGQFEYILRTYEDQPWKQIAEKSRRGRAHAALFRDLINGFNLLLVEGRNERLDTLSTTWPPLPPLSVEGADLLKLSEEEGFGIASRTTVVNRLDVMNARAQLVDAWRQIAVFGNSLLGTVNVQYHMASNTPIGQSRPFAFGASRYDHQLILNTQLPLVRVAERNNYRASLIAYQRQRRALMEAEDLAVETVRGEIRQLRVLAENYRIQQRQVELAYLTVENSLDTFQAPPAAGAIQSTAGTAAALTNQLLSAQARLPTAQNALLTLWISYLNTRLQLYRDLELMPLDNRGVWTDDLATSNGSAGQERGSQPGFPPAGTQPPGAGREDGESPQRSPQPESLPRPTSSGTTQSP
jgi:outer membrane protein TolC